MTSPPAPWSPLTSHDSFEAGLRALLVLNLFDALMTFAWIHLGLAAEANPVMRGALELGPAAFLLSKVALVGFAVVLLWRVRHRLTARLALVPVSLAYAFVGGGHLGFAIWKGLAWAPVAVAVAP